MSEEELTQRNQISIEHLEELIRPIRELSTVWSIKLSEYLDSFLDSLSHIEFKNDFTPDMLNFSQAGLFLQGSTNVLAKKVKHLYDLATSTASFDTLEGGDKEQGKRRRRNDPSDYINEDKLAPIEDPDVINLPPELNEKTPRQDITTMPKVPLCLLTSIDSQTTNESESFRVNLVPNEQYSIILLDPTINLDSLSTPEVNYDEFNISTPIRSENHPNEEKQNEETENQNQTNDEKPNEKNENQPPPPTFRNEEEDFDDNIPPPPENHQENLPETDFIPEISFLDPDSTKLSKLLKPMKKMKRFRIPKSFNEESEDSPKKSSKRFNNDIFVDMFEEIKSVQKENQKSKEREVQPFASISIEEGRDHILNDINSYQDDEIPPPDVDQDDDISLNDDYNNAEFPYVPDQPFSQTLSATSNSYFELCRTMVQRMVEMGERQVYKTEQNQVLSSWEQKIGPKLEKDLKRPDFKIDECEEWTIDVLRAHEGSILFADLTADLENHEISRVFLSVLVLANKERIRIDENASKGTNFNIYLNEK